MCTVSAKHLCPQNNCIDINSIDQPEANEVNGFYQLSAEIPSDRGDDDDLLPTRHRRTVVFRPLFAYRQEQIEKRRIETEAHRRKDQQQPHHRQHHHSPQHQNIDAHHSNDQSQHNVHHRQTSSKCH